MRETESIASIIYRFRLFLLILIIGFVKISRKFLYVKISFGISLFFNNFIYRGFQKIYIWYPCAENVIYQENVVKIALKR